MTNNNDDKIIKSILYNKLCIIKEFLKTKFYSKEFDVIENDNIKSLYVEKNRNISIYDVYYGFKIVISLDRLIIFKSQFQNEEYNNNVEYYGDNKKTTMLEFLEEFIKEKHNDKYEYKLREKKLERIVND